MSLDTILYIFDKAIASDPVLVALKATGYKVISAGSSSQGLALLFLMRSVAAVVLHDEAGEWAGPEGARTLRAIRSNVPIILLCRYQIDGLPSCVDVCVSLAQPLDLVISAVRRLLIVASTSCLRGKSSPPCPAV
jgi:DNA-binding response OmpR family regulator